MGQTARNLRADLEYRPTLMNGLSLDAAVVHYGAHTASRDGLSEVPAYTLIDIGARYRFKISGTPMTLRLQAANITDVFTWEVLGNNSFGLTDGRRFSAQLAADLYL